MKSIEKEHYDKFINFIFDPSAGCLEFAVWRATITKAGMIEKADRYPRSIVGWFNRLDCLKFEVGRLKDVSAYLSLNPIQPDLLARSNNEVTPIGRGQGTKEENIVAFRHILIDIDCRRPAEGISATDEELSRTIEIRDRILDDYPQIARSSLWGCSGNGAYIVVKIPDYPIRKGKDLAKSMLQTLAEQYGQKNKSLAFVDTNTFSPVFHLGIPGTYKCKGSSTDERPHRLITVDGIGS